MWLDVSSSYHYDFAAKVGCTRWTESQINSPFSLLPVMYLVTVMREKKRNTRPKAEYSGHDLAGCICSFGECVCVRSICNSNKPKSDLSSGHVTWGNTTQLVKCSYNSTPVEHSKISSTSVLKPKAIFGVAANWRTCPHNLSSSPVGIGEQRCHLFPRYSQIILAY